MVSGLFAKLPAEEVRHLTVSVASLRTHLDHNLATLRATQILQACSAFETALVGYFAMCRVYAPSPVPRGYSLISQSSPDVASRIADAFKKAREALTGPYTGRLSRLIRKCGLASLNPGSGAARRLDKYYEDRHRIVHGQGIADTDVLDRSANEIAAGALVVGLGKWQSVLRDFNTVVGAVDEAAARHVVKDDGLQLAVIGELAKRPATIAALRFQIRNEWGIQPDTELLVSHVEARGLALSPAHRAGARAISY